MDGVTATRSKDSAVPVATSASAGLAREGQQGNKPASRMGSSSGVLPPRSSEPGVSPPATNSSDKNGDAPRGIVSTSGRLAVREDTDKESVYSFDRISASLNPYWPMHDRKSMLGSSPSSGHFRYRQRTVKKRSVVFHLDTASDRSIKWVPDGDTGPPKPGPEEQPGKDLDKKVDDKEKDTQKEEGVIVPPDGGYGWVIVFACFLCTLTVDGIAYTFGVFLPRLVEDFDEKKEVIAWAGSLLFGVYQIVGPFTSVMINKYGCRPCCISGGIIGAAGFALSSLSNNFGVLMLTYGLIGGIGLGQIYLPAIVCVGFYFEKKRALATGIAICGSGVGTFVFAPVANILISRMSWRTANCVLAVIIFVCGLCGFLMKPLKPQPATELSNIDDKNEDLEKSAKNKQSSAAIIGGGIHPNLEGGNSTNLKPFAGPSSEEMRQDQGRRIKIMKRLTRKERQDNQKENEASSPQRTSSGLKTLVVTETKQEAVAPIDTNKDTTKQDKVGIVSIGDGDMNLNEGVNANLEILDLIKSPSGIASAFNADNNVVVVNAATTEVDPVLNSLHVKKTEVTDALIYTSSQNLTATQARDLIQAVAGGVPKSTQPVDMLNIAHIAAGDADSVDLEESSQYSKKTSKKSKCHSCSCRDICSRKLLDFDLLVNPLFILVAITNTFGLLGFYVPFVYLVDTAILKGVDTESAAFVLSIVGISNTVSRVVSGMISTLPKMSALSVTNVSLFLAGLCVMSVAFCGSSYSSYVIVAVFLGLFSASFISLTAVLLVDLLGLNKLASAFGLLNLFRGFAGMIGAPLAGAVATWFGTTNATFYLAGLFFIFASAFSFMIHVVKRCSCCRKGKKESGNEEGLKSEEKAENAEK